MFSKVKYFKMKILVMCILLMSIVCSSNSNSKINIDSNIDPIVIAFKTMTFTFNGKTKPMGQNGEIIFEQKRIILKSTEHKEWFNIISIVKDPKSMRFTTQNSQNEDAVFKVNFINSKIDNIKTEMFDGIVDFQIVSNEVTFDTFSKQYAESLASEKPGKYLETKRDDGIISKMYEPQIVADVAGMQIALSFLKSQAGNYVSVILRFEKNMRMPNGKMALRLSNDELLRFEPEKIQKSNIGNLDAVLGLFKCPDNYIERLKIWKVTNISLSFSDGSLNTYSVEANGDVLTKQIKLLK